MSAGKASEGDQVAPPPGFDVMPARVLDPIFGVVGQWAYRGAVDGASARGSGYRSREDACRAAWGVFRG